MPVHAKQPKYLDSPIQCSAPWPAQAPGTSSHPGSVEKDLNPAGFSSAFVLQKQEHNSVGSFWGSQMKSSENLTKIRENHTKYIYV